MPPSGERPPVAHPSELRATRGVPPNPLRKKKGRDEQVSTPRRTQDPFRVCGYAEDPFRVCGYAAKKERKRGGRAEKAWTPRRTKDPFRVWKTPPSAPYGCECFPCVTPLNRIRLRAPRHATATPARPLGCAG